MKKTDFRHLISGLCLLTSVRRLTAIALLAAAVPLTSVSASRELAETWDIQNGPKVMQQLSFFQAESVTFELTSKNGRSAFDLSDTNLVCVWEINGWDDYTNTYAVCTGEVNLAQSNVVTYALTPEQANLPEGTYRGYARALQPDGTNLVEVAVLAYQRIKVEWAPDSRLYNIATPLTYAAVGPQGPQGIQGETGPQGIQGETGPQGPSGTNDVERIAANESAITNLQTEISGVSNRVTAIEGQTNSWNTAYGWGDHAGLYLTLTDWATESNLLWQAIAGATDTNALPTSVFNSYTNAAESRFQGLEAYTNMAATALQSESDPAWHAGTNAIYEAIANATDTNLAAVVSESTNDIAGLTSDLGSLTSVVSTATATVAQAQSDIASLQTNPPAAGTEGSFQYNSGGHLAGFTNIWYDAVVGKIAIKAGENVYRLYNGITNAADATDSNLIFRLSNQSGVSQIEMGEDGDIGALIRGDGSVRFRSIDLGGVTRTNWYDYDALDAYIVTASNLFMGLSGDVSNLTDSVVSNEFRISNLESAGYLTEEADPVYTAGTNATALRFQALETRSNVWNSVTGKVSQTDAVYTSTVAKAASALQSFTEADPVAMPAISGLADGTDGFTALQLDRTITSFDDIGLTYSNAVRINNPVTITNDSAWTGWTTTGSLTASNEILLLTGQYLLSPEQSNGVARYEVSSYSPENGTPKIIDLLVGTNAVFVPYHAADSRLKITADDALAGATPALYISAVTMVGYDNAADAASVKYVAALRRTDQEFSADDVTSVRYVNAAQAAAEKHADASVAAYAADPDKTVVCDRLAVGNYVLVGDGSWQGVNVTQAGDRATFGTRFDEDIFTLESGLTTVELQSLSEAGNIVTLHLYAQNISGDITINTRPSLVTGAWTNVTATITDLGSGNYTAQIDTSTFGKTGFFRAYAEASPASAGAFIINAEMLNLDGHTITNVAEIVFTNGWKIACTTNGLEFIEP